MRVILLQDVEKIGKKWDVKEVALGYAKNYLIPRGLVKKATPKAMTEAKHLQELEAQKAEEALKAIQAFVQRVDGFELTIPVKVGETGEVFGSVTVDIIIAELTRLGFPEIKKSQITLEHPIRELGEHQVTVNFDHGLEAEIKVIVVEEKE